MVRSFLFNQVPQGLLYESTTESAACQLLSQMITQNQGEDKFTGYNIYIENVFELKDSQTNPSSAIQNSTHFKGVGVGSRTGWPESAFYCCLSASLSSLAQSLPSHLKNLQITYIKQVQNLKAYKGVKWSTGLLCSIYRTNVSQWITR